MTNKEFLDLVDELKGLDLIPVDSKIEHLMSDKRRVKKYKLATRWHKPKSSIQIEFLEEENV